MLRIMCRILLVVFIVLVSCIAFTADLNLAEWTPNRFLRQIGLSYQIILSYEHHLHLGLHFVVGWILTILLYFADLFRVENQARRIFFNLILMICLVIATEAIQSKIGRNVEVADLLFGMSGIILCSLLLKIWIRKNFNISKASCK